MRKEENKEPAAAAKGKKAKVLKLSKRHFMDQCIVQAQANQAVKNWLLHLL